MNKKHIISQKSCFKRLEILMKGALALVNTDLVE